MAEVRPHDIRPIDANALIEELRKHKGQFPADGNEPFMCWEVEGYINDQETLTQTIERPAKWEKATGMLPPEFHGKNRCSLCGCFALCEKPFREELSNYCPNCGAKMDGGKRNV